MLSTTILIKSILGIILSLGLFFFVGLLFNYLLSSKKVYWGWLPTYFYFICGMLLTVSLYAIFKTKGITILSIVPFLLLFLAKGFNKQFVFNQAVIKKKKLEPFFFLLISLIFSYLYYLQSFYTNGDTINYIWADQEYYARVAENINFLGVENMRVEYLYPERFTVEPFHYADLWSVAFAFTISSIKPIFGGVLVAFPILMALTSLGIATVIKHFIIGSGNTIVLYLLVATSLVGGFGFLFPSFLFPGSVDVYYSSMSNYTKLLWWASLLPLVYLLILNKSDTLIVFVVFIIGLGYINVLPSVAMGSFLWLFYISYKRGALRPSLILMLGISTIVALFIYLLYSFYPSLSAVHKPVSGKAIFSFSSIVSNFRTSVNIFIGGGLQLFVYLPTLILLVVHFWIDKVKFKTEGLISILSYSVLIIISALFVWALLYTTTMEAIQFFYNVFVVVAGLLSALIYVYVFVNTKKVPIKLFSIFLMFGSIIGNLKYDINVNSVSKVERDALFSFVDKSAKKSFAHYRDIKDYTADFFSSGTLTAMPYSILGYKIDKYENFSLNVPFVQLDTNRREYPFQKNNIDWAPMSHFVKMPDNMPLTQNEQMSKFMRQNEIGFLCLPINVAIPYYLKELVIDSLYTPKIGWKIYQCAYEHPQVH